MHTETTEIGPHQFFGITDQKDTPTPVKVTMYNLSRQVINSGNAILNIQTCRISQGNGMQLSIDQVGQPSTRQIYGRFLKLSLSVIPQGTNRGSQPTADSLLQAAACPPAGAFCTIENAPVMSWGPFDIGDNAGGGAFNSSSWQVDTSNFNMNAGAGGTVDLEMTQYTSLAQRLP